MKTLTQTQFRDMLFNLRGSKMVTITSETEPRLTGGKKCPLAGLVKRSRVNGVINFSYENAVNNQRGREETPVNDAGEVEHFTPEPRAWGVRLHALMSGEKTRMCPLVWKPDTAPTSNAVESVTAIPPAQLYLELKVQKSLDHVYKLGTRPVSDSEVEPYLPKRTEGARQEVEKPIILRDYKLASVVEITIDGENYLIREEPNDPAPVPPTAPTPAPTELTSKELEVLKTIVRSIAGKDNQ